jgi:hypothetical protein
MAVEDIKLTLPELLDSFTPGDEVTRTTVPGTNGTAGCGV